MTNPAVNRPERLLDRLAPTVYGEQDRGEWSEQIRGEEREVADRMVRLAELMAAGTPPSDPAVLDEIDWYYRAANQYALIDTATFAALGGALMDNQQTRAVFDDVVEGLAAYQREAMTAYAHARLSMDGA
jgi:hypothetical protein